MPTALILGSSGTLGSAIAAELHARGYTLGLHYNSRKEPCETLLQRAPDAALFQANFNDPAAAAQLAAAVTQRFQRLDALVWACGIVKDSPLVSQPESGLREVVITNLRGFFLVLKAFSRLFIKQKSGSVLALSSHAALAGRAGGTAYAMAHSGLISLVKSAAREWGPLGVRVNAVLPPFVAGSGMGRAASPEFIESAKHKRVLKTECDAPASFAKFATGVLENPLISGQILSADSRIA
ncbi:MAG TPA: SDR family oxidoreductase [Planctomycetota bacterium]|nr:SDR family oxidoreductase [Planctomycetota bacterium]